MKNIYCLHILIIITSLISVSGQKINSGRSNKLSVALTFAPITTFNYYRSELNDYTNYYSIGITETVYPLGANIRFDYQVSNRISVSSGLNCKTKKNEILPLGADMSYYESSTETKYVFEIPVSVNYNILREPEFFDLYISTGIRNSYFKRNYTGNYTRYDLADTITGEIDKHEGKFIIFYELGLGTYLKISKSLSFLLESDLTYTISGLGYLELQGGLRYLFN